MGDALTRHSEQIETVKRRAFIRACQRHRIICDRREMCFTVTDCGDLFITHRVSGLRLLRGSQPYQRCRHDVVVAQHSRLVLDLELDQTSRQSGYKIERQEVTDGSSRRRVVVLPESLGNDRVANYAVKQACANSIMMTRWEAEERARPDAGGDRPEGWDEEWVGTIVKAPVEEIVLDLVLPESLASVTPYVRCERPHRFPAYEIDAGSDDAEVAAQTQWDVDPEMRAAEERYLSYVPKKGCWRLVVRHPLVGYRYRLRWQLPGTRPGEPVPSTTQQWRELLVKVANRAEAYEPTAADAEITRLFGELGDLLEKLLGSQEVGERRAVELFVYDSQRLALRPVLSRRHGQPAMIPLRFGIELGNGLAGAAFQQRLTLPWAENTGGLPFVAPVPYPGEPLNLFRTMLAVPVYHPIEQDEPRPSPWSAICVVSFGSSSLASKIPTLVDQTSSPSNELFNAVRSLCQAGVSDLLATLGGGPVP